MKTTRTKTTSTPIHPKRDVFIRSPLLLPTPYGCARDDIRANDLSWHDTLRVSPRTGWKSARERNQIRAGGINLGDETAPASDQSTINVHALRKREGVRKSVPVPINGADGK